FSVAACQAAKPTGSINRRWRIGLLLLLWNLRVQAFVLLLSDDDHENDDEHEQDINQRSDIHLRAGRTTACHWEGHFVCTCLARVSERIGHPVHFRSSAKLT